MGADLSPRGDFGNAWRHFCLSQRREQVLLVSQGVRVGRLRLRTLLNILGGRQRTTPKQRVLWPQISLVPGLRNPLIKMIQLERERYMQCAGKVAKTRRILWKQVRLSPPALWLSSLSIYSSFSSLVLQSFLCVCVFFFYWTQYLTLWAFHYPF